MDGNSLTLPADLDDRVHLALKRLYDGPPEETCLDGLLIVKHAARKQGLTMHGATNDVLGQGMAVLRQLYPDDAALLQWRFYDTLSIGEIRKKVSYAESTVFARQTRGIVRLAQILRGLEAAAWRSRIVHADSRVGAPATTELVGTAEQVRALSGLLAAPASPWIVSIEGIGGIGKTALAARIARTMARTAHFEDFGWVSAQPAFLDVGGGLRTATQAALSAAALIDVLVQQLLPEIPSAILANPDQALYVLQSRLKRYPHLIVIDNLETINDLEALIPTLRMLANPSKFLLTSRRRLIDESDIYLHLVPELTEAQSIELIRSAANLHQLLELLQLDAEALRPIYQTVGGNPLALLLVTGQVHVRPLAAVLDDLQCARSAPAENLYSYIYRQAWNSLDETERSVLTVMPLVNPHGENIDYVAKLCNLTHAEVAQALTRLIMLNLVYRNSDHCQAPSIEHRYTIHSLTRTFLQEQVVRWT